MFSIEFDKNNKDNCYIIHDDKKYELTPTFKVKHFKKDALFEITLISNKDITDMSHMFNRCSSLLYICFKLYIF